MRRTFGLVVGRVSSGGSVESARAPPRSASHEKKTTSVATPASPPLVRAYPATEQQTSRKSNKQISSRTSEPMPLPIHPERQTLPASVPIVGKRMIRLSRPPLLRSFCSILAWKQMSVKGRFQNRRASAKIHLHRLKGREKE